MKTINVKQGSDEWVSLRQKFHTASEASAMMNVSPHCTRNELLRIKATGSPKEFSDFVQDKILDKGHEIESFARPLAETFCGDDLFPVTGISTVDEINLLASFDGLSMDENIVWECKTSNKELRDAASNGTLLGSYRPQLDQQLLVSGASKLLFTISDGTKAGTLHAWYSPDEIQFQIIVTGWKQFEEDLKNYEHTLEQIKPAIDAIHQLPALNINIRGEVLSTNLDVYKQTALDFISNIKTDLSTDSDFANAESMVKFCKNSESELEAAKKNALSQTSSIDELLKTINFIQEELRTKRLYLDKLVKTKKKEVKENILMDANNKLNEYIADIENELQPVHLPQIDNNFITVIKGKKTVASIHNAVDSELARLKIGINDKATRIRFNLNYIEKKAADYRFLFNDLQQIVVESKMNFEAVVNNRVHQHRETEKKRLEDEKARIAADERRKLEDERENIRLEEQRKAAAEQQAIANKQAEIESKKREKEQLAIQKQYEEKRLAEQEKYRLEQEENEIAKQKAFEENRKAIIDEIVESFIAMKIRTNTAIKVTNAIVDNKIKHVSVS